MLSNEGLSSTEARVLVTPSSCALCTRRRLLSAALALGPALVAPVRAQDGVLRLAVADTLAQALPELLRAFETGHPGLKLETSLAAEGPLLESLARGAVCDLLLSADADTVVRGIERRLLHPDSARAFAGNALVLAVPAASAIPLRRLSDLAGVEVQRIAMGRMATVPAGRYARQAIDAARLWPSLQRKIVQADSARHALNLVVAGDVDAGFVYRSDALLAGAALRVVETLSEHSPIRLTAALPAAGTHAALAGEFVQFLRGDKAQAVFGRFGFSGV